MNVYDIVVFGATSYTGKFICEALVTQCADTANVSWVVAGRSDIKLEKMLAGIADETGRCHVTYALRLFRVQICQKDPDYFGQLWRHKFPSDDG